MNHEIQIIIRYGSLLSVGLPQMNVYANYEDSIPCSYLDTDLSTETEHFDHEHAHAQEHAHQGYYKSIPSLRKGALKTMNRFLFNPNTHSEIRR